MRVVSNTSPVSNLAIIGKLDILARQFGAIRIPRAVQAELERLEHGVARSSIDQALAAGWLKVETVASIDLARHLASFLDSGEAEAIALASESGSDLLIMDESAGRAAARDLGLEMTGTLGVLLKEKRAGRIHSMEMEMDRLVGEAGFYLSEKVRRMFLDAAGE